MPPNNGNNNSYGATPVYVVPVAAALPSTFLGYVTGGASATTPLGTGAIGDYLNTIWIVPTSLSPGAVTIKDGSGSAITIFAGGAASLSNLVPFPIVVGAPSKSGGWSVTTLAGVGFYANGTFTA